MFIQRLNLQAETLLFEAKEACQGECKVSTTEPAILFMNGDARNSLRAAYSVFDATDSPCSSQ